MRAPLLQHPCSAARALPDDVRDHHAPHHDRLIRGAPQMGGLPNFHPPLGNPGILPRSALGLGWGVPRPMGGAGLRGRNRGPHLCWRGRFGNRALLGASRRFSAIHGRSAPLERPSRRRRNCPSMDGMVWIQRRVGNARREPCRVCRRQHPRGGMRVVRGVAGPLDVEPPPCCHRHVQRDSRGPGRYHAGLWLCQHSGHNRDWASLRAARLLRIPDIEEALPHRRRPRRSLDPRGYRIAGIDPAGRVWTPGGRRGERLLAAHPLLSVADLHPDRRSCVRGLLFVCCHVGNPRCDEGTYGIPRTR
mmetsp:Transcript_37474/g.88737  ORF Transcript_37474/g.88737 Transcript_37474/m.88737 type:complete len:304 (+) Transcript_37474:428-1339(+)